MHRFAIIPTIDIWWKTALANNSITVFHFPPGRNPQISNLAKNDICFIELYDKGVFTGSFRVKHVCKVSGDVFRQKYANRAFEVERARFPKSNETCWIIEFERSSLHEFPIAVDIWLVDKLYHKITDKHLLIGRAMEYSLDKEEYLILFSILMFLGNVPIRRFSYTKELEQGIISFNIHL